MFKLALACVPFDVNDYNQHHFRDSGLFNFNAKHTKMFSFENGCFHKIESLNEQGESFILNVGIYRTDIRAITILLKKALTS